MEDNRSLTQRISDLRKKAEFIEVFQISRGLPHKYEEVLNNIQEIYYQASKKDFRNKEWEDIKKTVSQAYVDLDRTKNIAKKSLSDGGQPNPSHYSRHIHSCVRDIEQTIKKYTREDT